MLIDSHAHIHFKDFKDDIDAVLQRAKDNGVTAIVNVGTDIPSSREVVSLAEKYPEIYAVVGIHPHDVSKMGGDDLKILEELLHHPKTVALGEVGLDYYYEHSPRELQQSCLRDFIRLAHKTKKPLVIHCRDAFEDAFRIFDEENAWEAGGVFHCFTGDQKTADHIVSRGFYLSFSGVVTFKKAQELRDVAAHAPMDKVLVETDCPFLAPEPYRGKRNEPAYVKVVAQRIADSRGVSLEEFAYLTSQNIKSLFQIKV